MYLPDSAILDNLYVLGAVRVDDAFEKLYISTRNREKRTCSDEEVANLPAVAVSHPHFKEWVTRKHSCDRLVTYLQAKNKPLNILEIGCGNGWLSFQLSRIRHSRVTGQDINFTELQQAARVFNRNTKIRFIYGDIFSGVLQQRQYDVIVFAASIQYFPSLSKVITLALQHLSPTGEVHIMDTHFYKEAELTAARQRTESYYWSLGFPEMAHYYFHHSLGDLSPFRFKLLYNPAALLHKLLPRKSCFPWICIKNK